MTTNATGNGNDIKDFSGSTVTVASTSTGSTISIAMDKQNLTHEVTNTLALNVSDLAFQSNAPLTIGEEYTVVINGANTEQTVYLFDSNQVLKASGTYNGNMNGNLSSGSYTTYMNSAFVAPEPATATLSLLALAALAALASRRKRH